MTLREKIGSLVATALPGYGYECDTERMMNVTADDGAFPLVFMDEYVTGKATSRYGWERTDTVELHFMDLFTFQGDAVARDAVRARLSAAVMDFIAAVNADGLFKPVDTFRISNAPMMFDANAVDVLVRVDLTYSPVCFDAMPSEGAQG